MKKKEIIKIYEQIGKHHGYLKEIQRILLEQDIYTSIEYITAVLHEYRAKQAQNEEIKIINEYGEIERNIGKVTFTGTLPLADVLTISEMYPNLSIEFKK